MPGEENLPRRHSIPILYTRGSYYDVGFDVGRTFSGLIHSFLETATSLNDEYIPAYETQKGKEIYKETLNAVRENFPQYIREIEGTADGAKVPFYKLFLLHMDNIILNAVENKPKSLPVGCSSLCVNSEEQVIGHTEDALSETLNHFYFVNAHIISEEPQGKWGVTEEHFTSLCYAGHLPGYTMGYNHHGLIFTINTLSAKRLLSGKIPRHILTRALLAAETFEGVQKVLRDHGCGAGNGCSVNLTLLRQDGDRLFHNIEMGPAYENNESQLSILTASPGENLMHVNMYQRLDIEEDLGGMYESSIARTNTLNSYPKPTSKGDVVVMLSDITNNKYPVFNDHGYVRTLAVGIFDCVNRTWAIYADNPSKEDPIAVLPLTLKDNKY